ncbi:MAG: hypothetical protein ACIAQ0_12190, partial [Phycisphaerales bacterium JB058]
DVINAVDPLKRITGCPLSLPAHCKTLCPMHARLDESIAQVGFLTSSGGQTARNFHTIPRSGALLWAVARN